jgi:hypothetical protein
MGNQTAEPTESSTVWTLPEILRRADVPRHGLLAGIRRLFRRPEFPANSYWYRAQFVIAAKAANAMLKKDPTGSKTAWDDVRGKALCLVTKVERALSAGVGGSLRKFLEDLEPSALILLAGTFIGDDAPPMEPSGDLADKRKRVRQMLQTGHVNAPFLVKMARSLPMSPRALYNLACYYSSQADYSRSIDALEVALSGLDASWRHAARDDDSLRGVKEHKSTRDKFRRLVSPKSQ